MAIYRELPNQNKLTGLNTLAYMGVDASTPPQFVVEKRAPTVNDSPNFRIGTFWLHQGTEDLWLLVAKNTDQLTDPPVFEKNHWTNLSAGGDFFITDDSNRVDPSPLGMVNVFGGAGSNITTEGINANTININVVRHPYIDALTITTFAAPQAQGILSHDNSGLIQSYAGLDGQILVSRPAGVGPTWVDLVSADNSITITNSVDPLHPGGINLKSNGQTLISGDDSLVVTPDIVTNIVNIDGLDVIQTERTALDTLSIGLTDSPVQAPDEAYTVIGGGPGGTSDWGYIYSSDLSVAVTPGVDGGGMPFINLTAVGVGGFGGVIDQDSVTVVPTVGGKVKIFGDGTINCKVDGVDNTKLNVSINYPTGAGAKGKVLIGSSLGAPVWANIVGAGGLIVTNGDGTLTLTQTGGGGGSVGALTGDDAAQATPDGSGFINVHGAGLLETLAAAPANTLTVQMIESAALGDIPIGGGLGTATKYGKLKSTTSTVTITPGVELSGEPFLDLASASFGGLKDDAGATAAPDAAYKVNVKGDGLIKTTTSANTITVGLTTTGVTDGKILIGNTLTGVPEWNTITGSGGITVSNSNGHITLTGGGGGTTYGIITLDLDSGTASDSTGTHVVRLEGGTNNTLDQSIAANQYINIYTRSVVDGLPNELAEVCMTDSLMLHQTNSAGTQGLLRIGLNDFMHSYGTHNVFLGENAGNRSFIKPRCLENVAIGYLAMRSMSASGSTGYWARENVAIGSWALHSGLQPERNVAIGFDALHYAQGKYNVALGCGAIGTGVSTGNYNVAIGFETLKNVTSGKEAVFIGASAGSGFSAATSMTTCTGSIALGYGAGAGLTTPENYSIAIGHSSSSRGTVSGRCIALGRSASAGGDGYNITIGDDAHCAGGIENIVIGHKASTGVSAGSNNISIGASSGINNTIGSNCIYLNNGGVAGEGNTIRIGDLSSAFYQTYITGIYNKTVGTPSHIVSVDSTGKLGKGIAMDAAIAFMAIQAADVNNIAGDGSTYYLGSTSAMSISEYDIGGTFNPGGGTPCRFTAPYKGLYQLHISVELQNIPAPVPPAPAPRVDPVGFKIYNSSAVLQRVFQATNPVVWYQFGGVQTIWYTAIVQMEVGDYALFFEAIYYNSGAKVLGIKGGITSSIVSTYVAGSLLALVP